MPGVGWHGGGKASGFEAIRPGLRTVGLSLLGFQVNTLVVITENPDVVVHLVVKITLGWLSGKLRGPFPH